MIQRADDPRLGDYRLLRDPAVRSRVEQDGGYFIAEGVTVVRRLLSSSLRVRSVLVIEGREHRVADLVEARTGEQVVPLHVVSAALMNELVGFDLHRGVLAAADRPAWVPLDELARTSRRLAVLEGINDHENLGALARSARALGIDGFVLDPTTADPWYRRSVRVSMGEIIGLPMCRCTDWPDALTALRRSGYTVVALTPSGDVNLRSLPNDPDAQMAVLLGAEGPGLTDAAMAAADLRVRIPIRTDVDSLNVGHAAAIAFAHLGLPDAGADA